MQSKTQSLTLLSLSSLLLSACGTMDQGEKLDLTPQPYYMQANKAVQPQVAHAAALLKEGRYSEASTYANKILQEQPENVVFHTLNAFIYELLAEKGDPTGLDLAIVGYQNALNIEPSHTFVLSQLGKIKCKKKKYVEAQEHFAAALLLKPQDANLLHEFAAASYYAFDIKKALGAIQKAAQLKPEDGLIQRSAAMIYAAMGDFKSADVHFKRFQALVGENPDVHHVAARFNDWQSLYKSGQLKLAAGPGQEEGGETVDVPNAGALPGGADVPGPQGTQAATPPPVEEDQGPQQIVFDAYMVEIHEEAGSSKGNNILTNLALTLSPGSYVRFNGNASGSGFLTNPTTSNGDSAISSAANASGLTINSSGDLSGTINSGTMSNTINNAGNFSGYVFTQGITWAGLTYALNIANAIDSRIELIGRPTMLTNMKKESRFFSGTELANVSAGSVGSSLSRYQIGVQLTVLPQSIVGDLVTVEVALETSNATELHPNLKETVSVQKTRLETTVKIHLGETVLLGGLYKRLELQSNSGVPGLKDIPLVQYFFANELTNSTRDSVALLITPRSPDVVKSAINRAMSQESVKPNVKQLLVRNPDWFHPRPNAVNILNYINLDPTIYYEFRTGDILPPSWGYEPALSDKLAELSSFLYF